VTDLGGVDVAVVVVTYNSADVVGDLLASLPAALGDLRADVVVVDNGSTDATREVIRGRTDCTLVESTNLGYSAGINRGVKEAAPAPAILVLNPDVRLEPGAVPTLLAALAEPRTGVVVPRSSSRACTGRTGGCTTPCAASRASCAPSGSTSPASRASPST
jgi:N-acetylglucosaminyl-diphospho-decaprenol L-rhamnosyltransferase